MKIKKIIAVLLIGLMAVSFAACGSNNSDSDKPKENPITAEEFKTEIGNLGIKATEEETMFELVGAKSGYKLSADGKTLELYVFDKDSEAYKNAEKDGKLTMESLGSDITENVKVANGYAIILPSDFPQYEKVLALFERLE